MSIGGGSALVVEVPDAEGLVGRHRDRLDSSAAYGVPAHVTVLFPFVSSSGLDETVRDRIARVAASTAPFSYRFSALGWFGTEVLYLAPDDAAPFEDLTSAVAAAFPDFPPYDGAFDVVIPHLTVGDGAYDDLRAAAADLAGFAPVEGFASHLTLIVEDSAGRWRRSATFALGARDDATATGAKPH